MQNLRLNIKGASNNMFSMCSVLVPFGKKKRSLSLNLFLEKYQTKKFRILLRNNLRVLGFFSVLIFLNVSLYFSLLTLNNSFEIQRKCASVLLL